MDQLQDDSVRRNEFILSLTKSSGDRVLDEKLLEETREELECGIGQKAHSTFQLWSMGPLFHNVLLWCKGPRPA